jgi:hypothetical protein
MGHRVTKPTIALCRAFVAELRFLHPDLDAEDLLGGIAAAGGSFSEHQASMVRRELRRFDSPRVTRERPTLRG